MKKIITLIILVATCTAIGRADTFDYMINSAVSNGVVTEIHVTKEIINMVSPELRKKIPLLDKVDGIDAVTVYTASNSESVKGCYKVFSWGFGSSTNGSVTKNLLTTADGNDYLAIYGTQPSDNTDYYTRIIMFTADGEKGQILVVYGKITLEVLSKITNL